MKVVDESKPIVSASENWQFMIGKRFRLKGSFRTVQHAAAQRWSPSYRAHYNRPTGFTWNCGSSGKIRQSEENKVNLDDSFLEKLRQLPPDKQREAIDFVEYLHKKSSATGSKRSLKGLWADLGVDISEEDFSQARKEMWGNFPREDV